MKQFLTGFWGLVYGTAGTFWAFVGYVLAFPLDSSPGTKEWAEDSQFIPLGYIMLALWVMALFMSYFSIRKNKIQLLVFSLAWLVGILICVGLAFLRVQSMHGPF